MSYYFFRKTKVWVEVVKCLLKKVDEAVSYNVREKTVKNNNKLIQNFCQIHFVSH